MAIKGFGMKSIHSFLSESVYYIPDYQREYAWDRGDQLEDFWGDLESAIEADRKHFFGQVVIHQDGDGKNYIIDGQQRTTTAVILLAALRDKFKNYEEDFEEARNYKEDIRIKYIGRWTAKKDELRLFLGMNDKEFFRENVQKSAPLNKPATPSQKRIVDAYEFFDEKISELIADIVSDEERVEVLSRYYEIFIDKFELMVITTDDINEAFIIFETLNARGKDLETSDLLKNNIFMKSATNIDEIKHKWTTMVDSLDKREDATKLIRYYWNASHNFTREKDLYRNISNEITNTKCVQFVNDLCDMVELYNALQTPEDNKYYQNQEITDRLANLAVMKATAFYPVVMAMKLNDYSEEDVLKVVKAIEVLVFRNFVVAGLTANKYEVNLARIAYKISEEKNDSSTIIKQITELTIDDDRFARDLIGLEVKTVKVAKMILREIEDFESGEKKTNSDNKVINLEHIMPKNNKQWQVDPEIHKDYLYRLGNQTLLLEEYNKSISNKKFDIKKEMYKKSKIDMTKALCEYEIWDEKAIKERENLLNEKIKKIWALQS